mmetsp:Transcript_1049/g.1369  ORF Transcript_1049/g.1369 Transcript_1049/m.1369 type:complete len:183 (+) Transcript_1049:92-640(+)|eukprot:CAMPEP_0117757886 /NCGR_PEP_ID=MMETSP0947-20121206/15022_1 /TAXON_ID=44440 /ORGANISM="Chattonella subsalsa, Strain CCMP2191" /LENGTH=182 /DNA_ID=CAMNT_0005577913 /DNA_START=66 /DNA_END=614 /DNA_ORIENTATION=+
MKLFAIFFLLYVATVASFHMLPSTNHAGFQTSLATPISPKQLVMIGEGLGSKGSSGAVLTKAPVQTLQKTVQKQKIEKVAPPERKTENVDCPMYKLILVGDEEYEGEYVVGRIIQVCDNVKKDNAWDAFESAMDKGEGLIVLAPKEHAEHYAKELSKSEPMIICDVKKEGAHGDNEDNDDVL